MQIETKMKLIENVKNSEFSLDVSLQTLGSTGKKVVKLKITRIVRNKSRKIVSRRQNVLEILHIFFSSLRKESL